MYRINLEPTCVLDADANWQTQWSRHAMHSATGQGSAIEWSPAQRAKRKQFAPALSAHHERRTAPFTNAKSPGPRARERRARTTVLPESKTGTRRQRRRSTPDARALAG